jgi:hypothetical protein
MSAALKQLFPIFYESGKGKVPDRAIIKTFIRQFCEITVVLNYKMTQFFTVRKSTFANFHDAAW